MTNLLFPKKAIIIMLFIIVFPFLSIGQEGRVHDEPNLIKFNALPLVIGKFTVEYERLLTDRISVGAEVAFRPSNLLPFRSFIEGRIDDDDVRDIVRNFRSTSFSITPEARFYTSRREAFTGFYVAPYLRYATYSANAPYNFHVSFENMGQVLFERSELIALSGNMNSFVGGVSVGANFKLAEKWYLDWRIVGPGFGIVSGSVAARVQLEDWERQVLHERLIEIQQELRDFTIPIRIDPEILNDGVEVRVRRSPWAAVRAGLSIAYRF